MTVVLAGGRPLVLLAERAAWLEAERTLLVADLHIGKATTFRALGVPVPRGTTSETLARLGDLVDRLRAERVVVLGDFLHGPLAHAPATLATVAAWRAARPSLEIVLVRGNHDDRAGDPPSALGLAIVDEPYPFGGLALCHHPRRRAGAFVVGGHLHPCVHVSGRAWDTLRLPCFTVGHDVAVLPAFGAFTGMHPIEPGSDCRVFAVAGEAVLEVPAPRQPRDLRRLAA